ncbi:MAG: hypothetical protein R6U40_00605, partial [Desulfobacterales bacterium]
TPIENRDGTGGGSVSPSGVGVGIFREGKGKNFYNLAHPRKLTFVYLFLFLAQAPEDIRSASSL